MMMTQQVPAMCYVPWQRWDELYEPSRAIMRGTMFPVLDKPFTGGRSRIVVIILEMKKL